MELERDRQVQFQNVPVTLPPESTLGYYVYRKVTHTGNLTPSTDLVPARYQQNSKILNHQE
jgi:hypothetical protein